MSHFVNVRKIRGGSFKAWCITKGCGAQSRPLPDEPAGLRWQKAHLAATADADVPPETPNAPPPPPPEALDETGEEKLDRLLAASAARDRTPAAFDTEQPGLDPVLAAFDEAVRRHAEAEGVRAEAIRAREDATLAAQEAGHSFGLLAERAGVSDGTVKKLAKKAKARRDEAALDAVRDDPPLPGEGADSVALVAEGRAEDDAAVAGSGASDEVEKPEP